MANTRYGRIEEKKQQKRLRLAIVGIIAILAFFGMFGFKLLVGFSLFIDTLRGSSPATQQTSQVIIFPPILNEVPLATKSSQLAISGTGQPNTTLVIYINEKQTKSVKLAKSATFSAILVTLTDGQNTISAKLTDDKGNTSDLSNILSIEMRAKLPLLEISSPGNNTDVSGESNLVTISGKTDPDVMVTINGRLAVLRSNNTFSYDYPLSDGDNELTIEARDIADNVTIQKLKLRYNR